MLRLLVKHAQRADSPYRGLGNRMFKETAAAGRSVRPAAASVGTIVGHGYSP